MSATVGAWLWLRSDSAKISCGSGLLVGLQDSVSGAWFRDPLSHSVVKLYLMGFRCILRFSISSRRWLLRMGMYERMMVGDNVEVL